MPLWVLTGAPHTLALGFLEAPLYPYGELLTSAEASLRGLHSFRGRVMSFSDSRAQEGTV